MSEAALFVELICFESSKCGCSLDLATTWASRAPAQRDGRSIAPLRAISQLAFKASCPGPVESGRLLRSQMVSSH